MKELHNITHHQMRTLMRNYNRNIMDRDKERITLREMNKDLIWPNRDKAFISVTKDKKNAKQKEINQMLELEIMFRQETIDQLNHDISLVDSFMEHAEDVCNDGDLRALTMFKNGTNIDKIGSMVNLSYHGVQYRIDIIIPRVLSEIRNNIIRTLSEKNHDNMVM